MKDFVVTIRIVNRRFTKKQNIGHPGHIIEEEKAIDEFHRIGDGPKPTLTSCL